MGAEEGRLRRTREDRSVGRGVQLVARRCLNAHTHLVPRVYLSQRVLAQAVAQAQGDDAVDVARRDLRRGGSSGAIRALSAGLGSLLWAAAPWAAQQSTSRP